MRAGSVLFANAEQDNIHAIDPLDGRSTAKDLHCVLFWLDPFLAGIGRSMMRGHEYQHDREDPGSQVAAAAAVDGQRDQPGQPRASVASAAKVNVVRPAHRSVEASDGRSDRAE